MESKKFEHNINLKLLKIKQHVLMCHTVINNGSISLGMSYTDEFD